MQSSFSSVAYEVFDELKYIMIVTSISICSVVILSVMSVGK